MGFWFCSLLEQTGVGTEHVSHLKYASDLDRVVTSFRGAQWGTMQYSNLLQVRQDSLSVVANDVFRILGEMGT